VPRFFGTGAFFVFGGSAGGDFNSELPSRKVAFGWRSASSAAIKQH
jgi:hypothetical protein